MWKAKNADSGSEPDAQNTDGENGAPSVDVSVADSDDAPDTIQSKLASVMERRDKHGADDELGSLEDAKGIIAQQGKDIDTLAACLETLLSEKDTNQEENADCDTASGADCDDTKQDSSDDKSKSMNADSADEIFRQRLSICRVGDKLRLDGLENLSIADGKRAIIAKVMPNIRLDGRSTDYVNCMYDIAVEKVNERKGVDYQRKQMAGGHADSANETSMASAARQRMLNREGGNQ